MSFAERPLRKLLILSKGCKMRKTINKTQLQYWIDVKRKCDADAKDSSGNVRSWTWKQARWDLLEELYKWMTSMC